MGSVLKTSCPTRHQSIPICHLLDAPEADSWITLSSAAGPKKTLEALGLVTHLQSVSRAEVLSTKGHEHQEGPMLLSLDSQTLLCSALQFPAMLSLPMENGGSFSWVLKLVAEVLQGVDKNSHPRGPATLSNLSEAES